LSVLGQKRTPVKLPCGVDSAAPSDGFRRSNRYQPQRVQMIAEDLDPKAYQTVAAAPNFPMRMVRLGHKAWVKHAFI